MSREWYDSHENLRALVEWMWKHDWSETCFTDDAFKLVIYFLEKPWKWQEEWEQFLKFNPGYRP